MQWGGNGFISAVSTNATDGTAAFGTGVIDPSTPLDTTDDTAQVGFFSFSGGRAATDLGSNMHQHVLGTVTVSPATIGSTTFLLVDCNPGVVGDFTLSDATNLDAAATNFTFNATAFPEPSAFLAVGLIAMLGGARRYFRRQDV